MLQLHEQSSPQLDFSHISHKLRVVPAPEYGYGDMGAGGVIPPKATLLFEVELLDWKEAGSMDAMGPMTMLMMAAGIAACVYMLG